MPQQAAPSVRFHDADRRNTQSDTIARRWTSGVPRYVSGLLMSVGLVCALASVGAAFNATLQPVRMFVNEVIVPAPPNLAYAGFLFVLAAAVSRRKWIAHTVLLVVLGAQLITAVFIGIWLSWPRGELPLERPEPPMPVPGWAEWAAGPNTVITIVALIVLILARHEFYGRARRRSAPKAIGAFLLITGLSVPIGYALVCAFPGSLSGSGDRLSWTVEKVLGGAITVDVTRVGHAPGWVNLVLSLFGTTALFVALFLLFRSQWFASSLDPHDELRLRALLADQGDRDSLGYFATRRDKAVLFSPTGKAAVTYRVVAGVCLISGDPVGDPEAWPPVIDRWLAMCREYTWTPAVIGASEDGAEAFARAGLKALRLGDEAIVDVAEFSLEGRDMRSVRQAVNRAWRTGYTTRIRRHSDVGPDEMATVVRLAHQWRDTETERGFSMALGRLGDPADGRCVLVEALNRDGQLVALLSFIPWGDRGLSLDVMRRDRDADNGVLEFMIHSLVRSSNRLGVDRISLNFAVFRAAFEEAARIGAGPVTRAWGGLLAFFSRWWQLESLYRSNVKYCPRWLPRFVLFRETRELAKVGVASAIAEGFLTVPGNPHATALLPTPGPETDVEARYRPTGTDEQRWNRSEQVRVRMDKVAALRVEGVEPYPVEVPRTDTCQQVRARYPNLPSDARTGERVAIAGRIVLLRDHGGVCFATLRDWSGDLQLMLTAHETGIERLGDWRRRVDIGDHVAVRGEIRTSRRGELSVLADVWTLAAKCLHPMPDKHRGLTGSEVRVRQRYLDLIVHPSTRDQLRARASAVHAVRDTLMSAEFLEVETPILQSVHGGANARPFSTHINAYDMRLYLRIASELYLKRLCVGGVERVFELGRAFRNEGVSQRHNPEFTMLEAYQAYADYTVMRALCQELIRQAAVAVNGAPVLTPSGAGGGQEVDLSDEWPVVPVHEAVSGALGEEVTPGTSVGVLRELCEQASVPVDPNWGRGTILTEMYERLVEQHTLRPTFYTDFPAEVSPLARGHRVDDRLAERWDLVAFGIELGTGYSELIDPIEQRRRLTEQSWLAAQGDQEAMEVDEDFLTALEYAMPPTGGLGLGVDRLVMLLTGGSIRDTLAFPLVRRNQGEP